MTESLRPLSRPRLYEQVVARLREYVEHEDLHAGDNLPPERELAERLGVSRTSVRQAIVALEVQGLVEVRHGGGTYLLRDRLDAESLETMIDRRRRLPDVLDARDALETKLAALAAERRTGKDLKEIDAALTAMAGAVERGELGVAEDKRFHAAVTTAAHSPLLAAFMGEIAVPIAESRAESLRQPGRPALSLAQHRDIAAAIHAGDQEAAARAMHHHVATVGDVKLLDWRDEETD
ncbi:FadR/GntR family transcriptional regulator [Streptomyces sp. V3I7]|uniref:FadR/GntR family transcriptional regulator n=1 Tax=Streptomyces sp. V3I7 TaxID=3042278 RepID=UPI00278939AC|nr:FadR/GntR family transcriptional regulator [Streptomyces sp. V3I7]MDQ0988909.1 GntR family transcriptional repressor for pyruvate dehydrogenase complex [Streptomyces sp. V3I7]